MGRPLNKRWFGTTGTGNNTFPIRANIGAGEFTGYIIKQRATRKFRVSDMAGAQVGTVVLVDKVSGLLANEGSLIGIGPGGLPLTIKKITSKLAVDFAGNRYKWTLQDDSTETLIILTAI